MALIRSRASTVLGLGPDAVRNLASALTCILVALTYLGVNPTGETPPTYHRIHDPRLIAAGALLALGGYLYCLRRSEHHDQTLIEGLFAPLQLRFSGTVVRGLAAQIDWLNRWWLAALPLCDIRCDIGQPLLLRTQANHLQLLIALRPGRDLQLFLVDPIENLEPRLSTALDPRQRERLDVLRAEGFRVELRRTGIRLKLDLDHDRPLSPTTIVTAIESSCALLQWPSTCPGEAHPLKEPEASTPLAVAAAEFRLAALDRALIAAISGGQASMIYEVLRKRAKLLAGTDAATASLAVQAVADHLAHSTAPANKVEQWQRWARALDDLERSDHRAQAA